MNHSMKSLFVIIIVGIAFQFGGATANAQTGAEGREATLEERLTSVLRVRTGTEKKFIKYVVMLVETSKLDQKIVDESFFWVRREIERKKNGDPKARKNIDKYPFFYFQRVLKRNAARVGFTIKI